MSTQLTMLAIFRFFQLEADREFNVEPIVLSSDFSRLTGMFDYERLIKVIGGINVSRIKPGDTFGYCSINFAPFPPNISEKEILLMPGLVAADTLAAFISFLWFVKDNASHLQELYINPNEANAGAWDSSFSVTMADGSHDSPIFTVEELMRAQEIAMKYKTVTNGKDGITIPSVSKLPEMINKGVVPSVSNYLPYNDKTRIERAVMFLNLARSSQFLPLKIAMYVPIYECLFANDNTAVNFKAGERLARFLGGTKEEKESIFKLFNQAYDIRSKMLHGATLTEHKSKPEKNTNLNETQLNISVEMDRLTRRVLTKVIMEESENFLQDDMGSYYAQLMFK